MPGKQAISRKNNTGAQPTGGRNRSRSAPGAATGQQARKQPDYDAQNRVKLNAESPIPFELGNQAFVTMGGNSYVPFFSPNDQFAQTLLEARLLSPTQSGCITSKNLYYVGQGLTIQNLKEGQTPDKVWKAMMERANGKRQTMNRVFEKGFESLQTFGNTPYEVVRGTTAGQKFMYIYVKNFLDCRLGKPNENGDIDYVLVSRQFRQKGVLTDATKVKKIPLYQAGRANDADNWLKDGAVERTIIWVKNEVAGYDHYGLPRSVPSLIYQVLEYGGARFNLDNLDNNMVIGNAIFLTGGITQEEADRIGSSIVRRHSGHGKRGRTAVFASENGIEDAKVVNMETHKDGSYTEMNEICESKIIFQHDWDAVLAGLKHTSSLGKGGGYLKEVYEQKLKTVIIPGGQRMVEDVFPSLKEIVKIWMKADWTTYEIGFEPIQLDNKTSEASTTVAGLQSFLDIIGLVASGAYEQAAAVELVKAWYGLSQQEATARLGTIKVIGQNVRTKSNGKAGTDNPAGDP